VVSNPVAATPAVSREDTERVKALLQTGELDQAEAAIRKLLREAPSDTELLYLLAVCLRYLERGDEAMEVLAQLLEAAPDYARAWQEQGHIHRAAGRTADALLAYDKAVSLNAALPASWRALAELHQTAGNSAVAAQAAAEFARLADMPPELVSVASMLNEGRLYKAERLCRAYLQQHPKHVEAMRLLARIGVQLHVLDDAEFLLESCLAFEPDFLPARMDYVEVLHRRQKFVEALQQARALRESDPANPAFASIYANQSLAAGEFETALTVYKDLLAASPDRPHLQLAYGHALKTVGRTDEAIRAYTAAHELKQDFGDAWWSLANLKTYRFSDAELTEMRAAEAAPGTTLTDRIHLCFALGKAYEDRQDYADSFIYYDRGNALHRQHSRYSMDRTESAVDAQIGICNEELFAARTGQGCPAPDPVFIVGLPRAGSTLLEQILASHSRIDGTMELHNILALAHRLSGRYQVEGESRYPKILADLSGQQLRQFGEDFISGTRFLRGDGDFFIDKMPNNFMHIGLIHLILPNARIIDARREPMACCFSNFKQLFGEGQEFTYGLEEIGRYYRDYVRLMDHWQRVLPGRILRVQYEDVVADLETQVRRILDFLGLPFEEACLNYFTTGRAVRTPSSEQVRQPIYTGGLEQWRHYAEYLGPLEKALGPELSG
jgi:tetratricopeptide (TPR) repeat protein